VGTMFLITGTALFATSVLARSQWLLAVACLVIGVQIERAGPPAGVISITLGVLLLLASWNRWRRRRRGKPAAVGAKARAARDALVRHMRDRVIPVPA
jgi:type VI protein secretion system component VasK